MHRFIGPLLLAFATGSALAAPTTIVITVDINRQRLWVEKVKGKTVKRERLLINDRILPINKDSLHAGTFRPTRTISSYRSSNGNANLENIVFLDGGRSIRTTRHFDQVLRAGGQPSGSILLQPDFGRLLFQTVKRYGTHNTIIRIVKKRA